MSGNIGHNSVQTPHDGKLTKKEVRQLIISRQKESMFRARERTMARRERFIKVRNGSIVPFVDMQPTPLVKIDGVWHVNGVFPVNNNRTFIK